MYENVQGAIMPSKYTDEIENSSDTWRVFLIVKGGFELSFYGGLKMHDLGGLRINRC